MAYWIDAAGVVVEDGQPYIRAIVNEDGEDDHITYPGQYNKAEIPGLTRVIEVERPDEAPTAYTLDGEMRGGVIVTGWHVEDIDGTPTQIWETAPRPSLTEAEAAAVAQVTLVETARTALTLSDRTVMRCVETGIAVPTEWAAYRAALRAIVSGGPGPIPARPAYPAGT